MDIRVYMDALEALEREIKGIVKKDSMSPAELVNMKEALCAAKSIMDLIGELPQEANDANSNGYPASFALKPGFKYEGYSGGTMPDYSYRRGRSATTGRYVSRGYDNHYSGHSIHDRMIAKLEELYNEGIGPHDEAVVAAGIRMIEQNR